jgi:cytochrome oxidase Cu insertion factor (SCO1/SenC/PrrC family)/thiol-disulfide isomerase/thioredoxin
VTKTRVLPRIGVAGLVVVGLIAIAIFSHSGSAARGGLANNPNLDPGTPVSGPAPDFTLTDQFGQPFSLHAFRGRVVILAFNDSQCTTICPLTTTAMVEAKQLLGAAGAQVQLLGIDANPTAITVADVAAYSRAHQMEHEWHFGTASLAQLKTVWKAYHIDVAIEGGQIDHTPALFVIDQRGRLVKLYMTQQAYSAVVQLGQLLAQEAASLLPGHPRVPVQHSYAQIPSIPPGTPVTLPRAGGGAVAVGGPHLYFFFASWAAQTVDVAGQIAALNHQPGVIGVDEGSVEPGPGALPAFLRGLHTPPAFPVGIDQTGRLADGYEVQAAPWLVLTGSDGRILWYYDVSTQGVLSAPALARHVRAALTAVPKISAASASAALAGSPTALAALHAQASQLLGSESALAARVRALQGHPVVLNAWASWCGPCRSEFSLFASASIRYGKQVAFLGVDTNDAPGPAQAFLAKHPVSYPSYQSSTSGLTSLVPQGLIGLPTTVFFDRNGKVVFVHAGQYDAQGSLDDDVAHYALGG